MAAFVGFDPLKSHRSQIVKFGSFCVAIAAASLALFVRHVA